MVKPLRYLLAGAAALSAVLMPGLIPVMADEAMQHYPSARPQKQQWSFSGPFGVYDKAQLQRGLKVYREVCATCHSLKFVAFRDLKALGYDEDAVKAFARHYEIKDGPDNEGEMFTRAGLVSDYFPAPYANDAQAAFANNGAVPVDLSLIARARSVPQPFPAFIGDVLTNYTTGGPDYIYALLTGYQDAPEGVEVADGTYYNPYFISADTLSMAQALYDDMVDYEDGTPQTVDHYARDVAAFLMWSADPHMETRKKTGFRVILFLVIFAGLAYCVKKRIWSELNPVNEMEKK